MEIPVNQGTMENPTIMIVTRPPKQVNAINENYSASYKIPDNYVLQVIGRF